MRGHAGHPRRTPVRAGLVSGLVSLVAVVSLGLGTSVLPGGAAPAAASTDTPRLPGRIGAPPNVLQMITVVSDGWKNTTGRLRAWERPRGGTWRLVHGPLDVVLGYHGWVIAKRRVQNTGTTPAGRFWLPSAFGNLPKPRTRMHYNHVDADAWWPYEPRDPATYNIYQYQRDPHSHWRADYAEHLASYQTQYAYAVIIGFNLPKGVHYSPQRHQRVADEPANTERGGGIFLHVEGSGLTAGCVATAKDQVSWLLGWLDPAKDPQIVMGPYNYVLHL